VIYNVAQVAELLQCTEEAVVERINAGDLPGAKFGRGWAIPADALRGRLNEIALEHAKNRRQGPASDQQDRHSQTAPIPMGIASHG
jgi:excisionase family DNA binding protein